MQGRKMTATIRKLTLNDASELLNFSKATFYEFFTHLNTAEDMDSYSASAFTTAKMQDELLNPGAAFYFAMLGGEAAGYLKVNIGEAQNEFQTEPGIEVERIYVTGRYHGTGIGSQLLRFAIETGIQTGKEFIWLGVWEKNQKAIDFYRRHDFEVIGQHDFMLGSDRQTDLLMRRSLV